MVLLRKIPLASHLCISGRGVKKHGVDLTTTKMLGCFRQEASRRQEFPCDGERGWAGLSPI